MSTFLFRLLDRLGLFAFAKALIEFYGLLIFLRKDVHRHVESILLEEKLERIRGSQAEGTYREIFQSNDLSQLEDDKEGDQQGKVAAPKIIRIQAIADCQVVPSRDNVASTF